MNTDMMRALLDAAEILRDAVKDVDTAVVLGSGLGDYGSSLTDAREFPYSMFPGFPVSTVPGHAGKMIVGRVGNKKVIVLSGRFHYYEGYSMQQVVMPVRLLARLGIKNLILTNAAGGVNPGFYPGCLMLLTDHINLSGNNPLIGPNPDELGPRFPDMSFAYDRDLISLARNVAEDQALDLKEGVYCMLSGPCYETPAEIRMLRILGADAVGMSTVPEVIAARHAGIRVMGISCITNMAAGISAAPLEHHEVVETGKRVREQFARFVTGILTGI
ncbi:MAG: purine-nucleoside phosphorylase [Clostridia bacterium]|nr:purine-nucleoside phosphorylase [Clostridia bacterium]